MAANADRKHPMFRRNSAIIKATQTECGICDLYVDKTKHQYDLLSKVTDHIIPLKRGGHLFRLKNLQLAHWHCNSVKQDRLQSEITPLMKRQMQLRIIQLTTQNEPTDISQDMAEMLDTEENEWLKELEDEEENA